MRDHTEGCSLQKYDLITRGVLVSSGALIIFFFCKSYWFEGGGNAQNMETVSREQSGMVGIRENITLAWTAKGCRQSISSARYIGS